MALAYQRVDFWFFTRIYFRSRIEGCLWQLLYAVFLLPNFKYLAKKNRGISKVELTHY